MKQTTCTECRYLQEERAGIHEFEGKAPRWKAEEMAEKERCARHRELTMAEVTESWARRKHAENAPAHRPAREESET